MRITADDLTAVIERGPGIEKSDGEIVVRGAALKRLTGSKSGHGMLKVIWRHGQKSKEDSAYRVTKSDVLALPEVVRSAPSKSYAEDESGPARHEWRRERFDGKTVIYATSRFEGRDDHHVVTIYVDGSGETMKKSDSTPLGEFFAHPRIPEGALSVVLPTDESLTGYFIPHADSVNEAAFGPITKAIGMPPVIRLTLPGVEDEASQ